MLPLSIPSPDWQGFDIGPFQIRAYALCILVGIFFAVWLAGRRLKQRGADGGLAIDVSIWAVVLGIIGARIYHVLTHPDFYFSAGADPWEVVRIWNGGIAIYGALLGGALGVFIGCRIAGLRFLTFADAAAPGILVAQAIGRWGNWFNHELFGQPTTLPWGLQIESTNPAFPHGLPADTLFHPTFLYESIWNLIGFGVILWAARKWYLQWGRVFALYLIWYSAGRFVWEGIRIDPSIVFAGMRLNQFTALVVLVLAVVFFIVQGRRHPGLEPSPYLPGREPVPVVQSDDHAEPSADDPVADEGASATSDAESKA